jgi:hypothetical protein
MAWSVLRCASAMGVVALTVRISRLRLSLSGRGQERRPRREHASDAEHPTERVCGHFKDGGRIGSRRQRFLFMVKQEFKVETICRRHSQSGDFPVTDGEARWLVRFAGDHHRWMAREHYQLRSHPTNLRTAHRNKFP